ncbi:MAG: hypothetical protein LBQ81_02720 [Zoogloeaceae bacterium]|nr:hypothetical protein [Zoogloeaceae bacterium]
MFWFRVVLPDGEQLLLAANIFDEIYAPNEFTRRYRRRWRVEEACLHAPEPDAKGRRHRLNRTLSMKCPQHFPPRLLRYPNPDNMPCHLIQHLRVSAASERPQT